MSVKETVLETLKKSNGEFVSGEKLSEGLGVSRAAVWKGIKSLREDGYRIEAVTNRGYRLVEGGKDMDAGEIRKYLPSRYKGNSVHLYSVIDSTNFEARRIEANHGTIVVAEQQTAGRGRLGRSFFSPREGVYISIIVKPRFDTSMSVLVTTAAASAVAEAIDEVCGQDEETQIKWVNDVYLKGRKVCGILTEGIADFETGQIESMIVGIGINANVDNFPEDLKKVAGAVEGVWSKDRLVAEIATRFLDYISQIDERRHMETYRKKSMLIGHEVNVYIGTYTSDPEKELMGFPAKVTGIGDDGGLEIIREDGSRQILTTGEVSIRPKRD